MTTAILQDDIGIVNFTLVKDVDKTIRAEFSTDPAELDISSWQFEVAFYIGKNLEKTVVLASPATITVNTASKYVDLHFTAATLAAVGLGYHQWDLRYDTGTGTGQILKGQVTLYRVIKHHPEELYKQYKFSLVSRSEFDREQQVNPETLTDVQRAARYLFLQKCAFGGHITGQTFGMSTTGKPRFNLLTLESTIEKAWQRLIHVQIECKDFRDLIPRYDRPHSFFFLDPPYWKVPGYKHDFQEPDFLELAAILSIINGKFLMTINDTKEVRAIFKDFFIQEVTLKYSMSTTAQSRAKQRTELLISNYI